MFERLWFLATQVSYDLRVGLLLRPALITGVMAVVAILLPMLELHSPWLGGWMAGIPWLSSSDAASAQIVLGTIAGSMMTVLSITYSVLLMALSLASVQFSPRILSAFMRDGASQTTMGMFVGTFVYCLLVLRVVHGDPHAFVPPLSMLTAVGLALLSLGFLIYFIHHISSGIQANYIVDRIAAETEAIIDACFPAEMVATDPPVAGHEPAPEPGPGTQWVPAPASGYVQLVDEKALLSVAAEHGVALHVLRGVGEFVVEGAPLVGVVGGPVATDGTRQGGAVAPAVLNVCRECFDIGAVRTMQEDTEFGVRQIVDIALKAVSPAVNDPSTAVTCIDHLGRLVCRLAARADRAQVLGSGAARVFLRRATFRSVLDLAFNQIRQYGKTDMAVTLRLLRVLGDVARIAAQARRPDRLEAIERHVRLLPLGADGPFAEEACPELASRLAVIERALLSRNG
jgi:uncharacterized membrane protein